MAVILRAVAARGDGFVDDDVGRTPSCLNGGQVDDRLEGRSGLAQGLRDAVELAVAVTAPADHRQHRAAGVHNHGCALADVALCAIGIENAGQGALGAFLHAGAQGGFDDDVFFGRADEIVNAIDDPVGEITFGVVVFLAGRIVRHAGQAFGFVLFKVSGIHHDIEHRIGTLPRQLGVLQRRIARGCLEEARDDRSFAQIDILDGFAEIKPRRRIDAVNAGAEVDAVEIG